MFLSAKIIWSIFQPINLIMYLLILGCFLYLIKFKKIGFRFISLGILLLLIFSILPIGYFLSIPLENRFNNLNLPRDPHGIIVLGGAEKTSISYIRKQISLNKASERLLYFSLLSKKYPNSKLVYSGGGVNKDYKYYEYLIAYNYFKSTGMNENKIIFEKKSRNTFQNAKYSYDLIKPQQGEKWILITSALSMPRAIGSFRKVGWDVTPFSVDYQFESNQSFYKFNKNFLSGLNSTNIVLYEWFGLIFYKFMNRTDYILPGPKK